ncbi:MAG TPA: response regulator transcription factor [Desulfuromonadaceae bacterium]|nr:response regulator transcription factor [Desulfuromonadaceae bacterium]
MISVSLVEDHVDTRESLITVISGSPGFRCVGAYATAEEALRRIPEQKPDVALVDINLPGMSGIECVAKLKQAMPDLPILMLTTYEESELIFNSLRAGARGYLLKKMAAAELIPAIEQVHAGGAPMSMPVACKVVDYFQQRRQAASDMLKLTAREQEILALLSEGYLYKEIGDRLSISFSTVRAHLRNIYEKLHVQSRTEAAARYLESR